MLLEVPVRSLDVACCHNRNPAASPSAFAPPDSVTTDEMEAIMDHVYPVTEIYGSSTKTIDELKRLLTLSPVIPYARKAFRWQPKTSNAS